MIFLNDSNYTYITCSVAPPSSVDSSTGWSDRTAAHWPIPPELPNWEDCCVHHSIHKTCYGKPILLCLLMLFLPSGISAPFFSADLFKSYQFVRSLMWPPHNFSCILQRTSSLHYLISLFILFWHTILRLTLYNFFMLNELRIKHIFIFLNFWGFRNSFCGWNKFAWIICSFTSYKVISWQIFFQCGV